MEAGLGWRWDLAGLEAGPGWRRDLASLEAGPGWRQDPCGVEAGMTHLPSGEEIVEDGVGEETLEFRLRQHAADVHHLLNGE